ncbi:hypothetical protein H696_03463 [Fonticula alba]|uniref:JmjC domain-containing protein n=1 Tax=Fonticula alba TaxID=691883 RepID=A0A058Z7Y2_FONAL|nr:hypothetical protein H696_03463 [Fonticula alba]KCV69998.1 hypothetical protein H696_03463 [Fonticula alba]|eukprot:XP_009495604.1 hypothetical protein H696_03463 [Fonticula alba]
MQPEDPLLELIATLFFRFLGDLPAAGPAEATAQAGLPSGWTWPATVAALERHLAQLFPLALGLIDGEAPSAGGQLPARLAGARPGLVGDLRPPSCFSTDVPAEALALEGVTLEAGGPGLAAFHRHLALLQADLLALIHLLPWRVVPVFLRQALLTACLLHAGVLASAALQHVIPEPVEQALLLAAVVLIDRGLVFGAPWDVPAPGPGQPAGMSTMPLNALASQLARILASRIRQPEPQAPQVDLTSGFSLAEASMMRGPAPVAAPSADNDCWAEAEPAAHFARLAADFEALLQSAAACPTTSITNTATTPPAATAAGGTPDMDGSPVPRLLARMAEFPHFPAALDLRLLGSFCTTGQHSLAPWAPPGEPAPGPASVPELAFDSPADAGGFLRAACATVDHPPRAVLLGGLADGWPAVRRWAGPQRLVARLGGRHRSAPVELGASYCPSPEAGCSDANWQPRVVFLGDLAGHIGQQTARHRAAGSPDNPTPAYLAQFDLFHHFPEVRGDICIPDLCFLAPDELLHLAGMLSADGESGWPDPPPVETNVWIGPPGTYSPPHTDPRDNIYTQVHGFKVFRIWPPTEGPHMAAPTSGALHNTSAVPLLELGRRQAAGPPDPGSPPDPLGPIAAEHQQARYVDVLLAPGRSLFIPRGWWHAARSLTSGAGVNNWFDLHAFLGQ